MTYCMSDIHGELDKFSTMLNLIQFSKDDHLYIIGDVIDRGPDGVAILEHIMNAPNMTLLMGNHEQMCLDTLGPCNKVGARELWKHNGGDVTYQELIYNRAPCERDRILKYLDSLPDHLDITVKVLDPSDDTWHDRKFYLVHAFPALDYEDRIWKRPDAETVSPWEDVTCIVGHTPTPFLTHVYDKIFNIWYSEDDTFIDIDCGCGDLHLPQRRLACLRLDDGWEFYT